MKIFILLYFLICNKSLFSENIHDSFDFKQSHQIISNRLNIGIYTIYKDNCYYILDSGKTKIVKSFESDLNVKLNFPDSLNIYNSEQFAVNENYLVVTDWEKVHIFLNKNFNFTYKYSLKFGYPIESIKIDKKLIYLQGAQIGNNINLDSHTVAIKIDIDKNDLNLLKLKNPEEFGFSFFVPKNIIDFKDTLIYVSNFTKYKIDVFNWEGKQVNCIERLPEKWLNSKIEIPRFPKGSNKPGKYIFEIMPYLGKQSIINKIYFVDSNQILVGWTLPNNNDTTLYDYMFDIWKLNKDNKWEISAKDLYDVTFDNSSILSKKSFSLNENFNIVNNYLFTFNVGNNELFLKTIGESYKDYKYKLDNFIIENPLQYILGVYKIKQ